MAMRAEMAPAAKQEQTRTDARLQGRTLWIARTVWIVVAFIELLLFLLNLLAPVLGSKTTICPFSSACGYAPTTLSVLQQAQIPLTAYTTYLTVLGLMDALITVGLGVLIFWRKSDHPSSLLASFLFLLIGAGLLQGDPSTMPLAVQEFASAILTFCTLFCLGFFIVTFPDGRFVPRWSWLIGCTFLVQGIFYQLPGAWYLTNWPAPVYVTETLFAFGSPVALQIYRYVRVSSPAQRQQTKWVIFGLVNIVVLICLQTVLEVVFPSLNAPNSLYPLVSESLVPSLAFLLIPFSISRAVLSSRLWEIDVIIRRTLVYSTLTVILALMYAGIVFILSTLLHAFLGQGQQNPLIIVASTLVIAALFQPLRRPIQSIIDRRFYRRKYDAAQTLAAFGATMRQEVDVDQLREKLVVVVQETMQPTHVSLWLRPTAQDRKSQATWSSTPPASERGEKG